jgi:Holliday junction resolvase
VNAKRRDKRVSKRSIKVGKGFEYRVRDWFRRAGFEADRVPLSGASSAMKGDVVVKVKEGFKLFIECKRRTGRYKELFQWIEEAMGKGLDVIVLGVGRQKPLVVMKIDKFLELLKRG